MTWQTPELGVY